MTTGSTRSLKRDDEKRNMKKPQRQSKQNDHPVQVQSPLNLRLAIKRPYPVNMAKLLGFMKKNQDRIANSLNGVYFIHFARFLKVSGKEVYIITTYDGDFYIYMMSFLKNLGWFFNGILPFVEGGDELIPVGENVEKFSLFAQTNDVHTGLSTPYPGLTVLDIMNNAGLLPHGPQQDSAGAHPRAARHGLRSAEEAAAIV